MKWQVHIPKRPRSNLRLENGGISESCKEAILIFETISQKGQIDKVSAMITEFDQSGPQQYCSAYCLTDSKFPTTFNTEMRQIRLLPYILDRTHGSLFVLSDISRVIFPKTDARLGMLLEKEMFCNVAWVVSC